MTPDEPNGTADEHEADEADDADVAAVPTGPLDPDGPPGPMAINITAVRPTEGLPGTPVSIYGSFETFDPSEVPWVTFHHRGTPLSSGIDAGVGPGDWTHRLDVEAPDLGAGGAATITVHTIAGNTSWSPFVLHERAAPVLLGVAPPAALAGTEVSLSGAGFGVGPFPGGSVEIIPRGGGPGAAATARLWDRTTIRFVVPGVAAGPMSVVVRTPWGTTGSADFMVMEGPVIVPPVSPSSVLPDQTFVVVGRAFGPRGEGRLTLTVGGASADAEIAEWADDRIRAWTPSVARLDQQGPGLLSVRTPWGVAVAPLEVLYRDSVTTWTRLEAHARTDDLEAGLRDGMQARTYDALWLLGRQWQLGEFRGGDGGSPVQVRFQGETAPLTRWRPGSSTAWADLPPVATVPLSALVERDAVRASATPLWRWSRTMAVDSGLHFLRLLSTNLAGSPNLGRYRDQYRARYATAAPSPGVDIDEESLRFLSVVAARVPDGERLYRELRVALPPSSGGSDRLPPAPAVDPADTARVRATIVQWFEWCDRLVSQSPPKASGWLPERMEHDFGVSARTTRGDIRLEAADHPGGALDWYAFDVQARIEASGAGSRPLTGVVVPAPVRYPGMPARRWWELEDADIDLGRAGPAPSQLNQLLLIELANAYGTDWFVAPLGEVPLGSVGFLSSVAVLDTFGRETSVPRFTGSATAGAGWAMFELSTPRDGSVTGTGGLFCLPHSVATRLESSPLEEVALLRDELANMGWAVEHVVESVTGRPQRRAEAGPAPTGAGPGEPAAALRYQLATQVPAHWIALVHTIAAGRRLMRAGNTPLGAILGPASANLMIFDEEVPRDGVVVTRAYSYARWVDGSTHLWTARRKRGGRGEGSSGLRFDTVAWTSDVPGPP